MDERLFLDFANRDRAVFHHQSIDLTIKFFIPCASTTTFTLARLPRLISSEKGEGKKEREA